MTEGDRDCIRCGTCGRGQSAVQRLLRHQYDDSTGVSCNSGSFVDGIGSGGEFSIAQLLGQSSSVLAPAPAAVVAAGGFSDRPKNSDVNASSMRKRWWCRFLYRARSRSQRRRLLLWTVALCGLLTLFYYNHQGLGILSQASSSSRDYDLNSFSFFQAAPMANMGLNKAAVGEVGVAGEEMVGGRHPRALLKQAGEVPAHGVVIPAGGMPELPREERFRGAIINDVKLKNDNENENEGEREKMIRKTEEEGKGGGRVEDEEEEDDKSDLRSDLAPATLHFVWCSGQRHFEFRHFMAIRRAERLVRPDKIFLHYDHLPVVDPEEYFLWFNRTLVDVPNILLRPLSATNASHPCALEGSTRYLLVLDILHRFGGIYIPEDALLVDFPVHLRSADLVIGVRALSPGVFRDGLLAGRKDSFKAPSTDEELLVALSRQDQVGIAPCGSVDHYNNEEDGECVCIKVTSPLYPKDILENHSPFGTLARLSAYDVQEWEPQRSLGGKAVIPRIAHYVCIDCEVRFILFLSMRSSVNVAGLNKVYLHGVKEPRGKWWDKLKEDSRFVYVHREYPETPYELQHDQAVAMMRISILLKYGGVYCDEKVLWTQRIPDAHFGYSAVASPDWHLYGSWPDSMNHATLMARKNAPYLLRLRSVLHKNQRDYSFWFLDHFKAYKIYETHPDSLFLDRHLQVKCLNHNCHPTWVENYKSGLLQNRPGPSFRWQNETLSVHWTDTFPELDLDTVKYTSGMVVEVCRNILRQSGMVIQDLR